MKVVLDNNIALSAYLFGGMPRQVLAYQASGRCEFLTSDVLLTELSEVLHRQKFAGRIAKARQTPDTLYEQYQAASTLLTSRRKMSPTCAAIQTITTSWPVPSPDRPF
ncbi:MAG: PIN domain-containing protein [Anaerolineae bacterium]|nr:PIN domain-containing protein [Anaerolineae bacterium]